MNYIQDMHEKPCPFCGGKRQYAMSYPTNIFTDGKSCIEVRITCHMCGATTYSYDPDVKIAMQFAIEKWNNRRGVA